MTLTVTEHSDVNRPRHRAALLSLLILIGALVTYKTATALRVIERVKAGGALPATSVTAGLDVVSRAIDYLAVIWPALLFGILISATVRTFISPESLVRLFGHTARRAQLTGGLAGSPLMLCSCCVAPIFSTVYRDSSRLAPSLALMLSAPSLNPAALVLTFMLFAGTVAWARLLLALVAVFFGTLFIARFVPSASGGTAQHLHHLHGRHHASSARPTFLQSCVHVIVRAVPPIAVGVLAGFDVRGRAPIDRRIRGVGRSPHNDRGDCGNCCPCSATHLFRDSGRTDTSHGRCPDRRRRCGALCGTGRQPTVATHRRAGGRLEGKRPVWSHGLAARGNRRCHRRLSSRWSTS